MSVTWWPGTSAPTASIRIAPLTRGLPSRASSAASQPLELTGSSEVLRGWWAEHAVQAPEPVRKRIRHATLGPLNLLQSQSCLAHRPSLRLRMLVPADDHTRRVLADAATCTPR